MAMAQQAGSSGAGSAAGTGSSSGSGGIASFGGVNNIDNRVADYSNVSASASTAYAPVMSVTSGSTLTYTGSDYGALAAAATIYGNAQALVAGVAESSQITSRLAISKSADTIGEQGAGALKLITKPFIWLAAIVAVAVLGFFFMRGKRHGA